MGKICNYVLFVFAQEDIFTGSICLPNAQESVGVEGFDQNFGTKEPQDF